MNEGRKRPGVIAMAFTLTLLLAAFFAPVMLRGIALATASLLPQVTESPAGQAFIGIAVPLVSAAFIMAGESAWRQHNDGRTGLTLMVAGSLSLLLCTLLLAPKYRRGGESALEVYAPEATLGFTIGLFAAAGVLVAYFKLRPKKPPHQ